MEQSIATTTGMKHNRCSHLMIWCTQTPFTQTKHGRTAPQQMDHNKYAHT